MRRALVLGAGGFLGARLVRDLLARGWDVTGVLRDRDEPHAVRRLGSAGADARLVEGDAGDEDLLRRLVTRGPAGPVDAVFPFAGRSGAARSMEDPRADLLANGLTQLTLLEVLRRTGSPARVVFPGSRLQYGPAVRLPVHEDDPLAPTSAYGVHKLLSEQHHLLYHRSFGVATTSLRITVPYGPHQSRPDAAFGLVGTLLATAASGQPIRLFGGGTQRRDPLYVGDLVDLCVRAATDPVAVGQVYNAGGSEALSIRTIAEAVVATVGRGDIVDVPWPAEAAAVETGDHQSDCTRAERELGWVAGTGLEEGLARTWEALAPTLARPG